VLEPPDQAPDIMNCCRTTVNNGPRISNRSNGKIGLTGEMVGKKMTIKSGE